METNYKWYDKVRTVHYESKEEFLWINVMGGCGCGSSEAIQEMAWRVFELFATSSKDRWKTIYGDPNDPAESALTYETLAHWLDSKDLIEHGSSIAGSWLNENGQALYEDLLKNPSSN